jgi:hypothetical protein
MKFQDRGRIAALALTAIFAAACGGDDSRTAQIDADLQRDLQLAGRTQQLPVTFQDTALGAAPEPKPAEPKPSPAPASRERETRPTPTPRRPPTRVVNRPAPRPSAPRPAAPEPSREVVTETPAPAAAPARGAIGAGTTLALSTNGKVCTVSNRPGDKITATVGSTVTGVNGAVIPAGSTVVLEVADVETADPVEQSRVRFRIRAIDVNGESYSPTGGGATTGDAQKVDYGRSKSADQKKVIGGAVLGAIAGQIMGRDTKSTIIGAAAGAAAGTAAAKMSGKSEGCFPEGAPVRITLEETVVMR